MLKKKMFLILFFILLSSILTIPVQAKSFGLSATGAKPNSSGDSFIATIDLEKDSSGKVSVKTSGGEFQTLSGWWNKLLTQYKYVVFGVVGMMTLTMILVFIKLCLKLASSESNPKMREWTIRGTVLAAVAAAALGSLTTYVAIASHIFM